MSDEEYLQQLIDDAGQVQTADIFTYQELLGTWITNSKNYIIKKYGKESSFYKRFDKIDFLPQTLSTQTQMEVLRVCAGRVGLGKDILKECLEEIKEKKKKPEEKSLTSLTMELNALIDESKHYTDCGQRNDMPFKIWYQKTSDFLETYYGNKSNQYKMFSEISFENDETGLLYFLNPDKKQLAFVNGMKEVRKILSFCLDDLEKEKRDLFAKNKDIVNKKMKLNMNKIFIVHGHNAELKEQVKSVINDQNIKPIILAEQVSKGKTVIEKIEEYSDVGAAVCLFTCDDNCKNKNGKKMLKRARQNVVLETGYFWGKLGRDRIVFIAEKDVEMPSDMGGVVYTDKDNWKVSLLQELKAMGFDIDFNKLF